MSKNSKKVRVGILRGGASPLYEASIKTGGMVLSNLPKEKYKLVDMLVTRDGTWHVSGLPATRRKVASHVDVIFNALHDPYGIDGNVHKILGELSLPYTGSNFLDSTLGLSRPTTKHQIKSLGLKTPTEVVISACKEEGQNNLEEYVSYGVRAAFEKISPPWVVKPIHDGIVTGTYIVETIPQLRKAIQNFMEKGSGVLVEEFIKGRKITSGVIENFRGQKRYHLLPIGIEEGETVPLERFSKEEKETTQSLAAELHEKLGLKHYSQTDFIISPKRDIYVMNIKALPEIHEQSPFYRSLQEVGSGLPEFLDHLIVTTLEQV